MFVSLPVSVSLFLSPFPYSACQQLKLNDSVTSNKSLIPSEFFFFSHLMSEGVRQNGDQDFRTPPALILGFLDYCRLRMMSCFHSNLSPLPLSPSHSRTHLASPALSGDPLTSPQPWVCASFRLYLPCFPNTILVQSR